MRTPVAWPAVKTVLGEALARGGADPEGERPDLRRFRVHSAERHTVVRSDGRGIGLSDRFAGDVTHETRQRGLAAVLTAVGGETAAMLGIAEGGWSAAAMHYFPADSTVVTKAAGANTRFLSEGRS